MLTVTDQYSTLKTLTGSISLHQDQGIFGERAPTDWGFAFCHIIQLLKARKKKKNVIASTVHFFSFADTGTEQC